MAYTYLITFHTYGSWHHGDQRGSVSDDQNRPGDPLIAPSERLVAFEQHSQSQAEFTLDQKQRACVQQAILNVCAHRSWTVHALHVRTNHVHAVVRANAKPEQVMNDFKAYATRALRAAGLVPPDRRVWSRHGSTRWLNTANSVARAIEYTNDEQGKALD